MKLSRNRLSVRLALAGGLGALAVSPAALASGFAIPESSIAGIGTSNALVANPEEIGAIVYNPAAMGFHEHSSVTAGLMFFMPTLEVTTASGNQESEGESTVLIPNFQGALKVNERFSIGLGVTAPFGLETVWPVGTFPQLSTPIPVAPGITLPPGLFHPTQSKLELAAVTPTVAYRVNDSLSLAAGVDYYNARELKFNTGLVRIDGDGEQSRDFVFIDDVVRAWIACLDDPRSVGRVFNLGSGTPTTVNELCDAILDQFGHTRQTYPVTSAAQQQGDVRSSSANITAIQEVLDWTPRVSFAEGLQRTVMWARRSGAHAK